MDSNSLPFKGALTLEDYILARRLHGRGVLPFWAPAAATVVGGMLLGWLMRDRGGELWLAVAMVLAGAFMLAWRLALGWSSRRAWEGNETLRRSIHGQLTPEVFHAEAGHDGNEVPWESFHQWKASDDLLLIYKSPRRFIILPRRWFADAYAWRRAKDLAASRLPSRQRSQRRRFIWLAVAWTLFGLMTAVNYFAG